MFFPKSQRSHASARGVPSCAGTAGRLAGLILILAVGPSPGQGGLVINVNFDPSWNNLANWNNDAMLKARADAVVLRARDLWQVAIRDAFAMTVTLKWGNPQGVFFEETQGVCGVGGVLTTQTNNTKPATGEIVLNSTLLGMPPGGAAGTWFIDPTPELDEEFTPVPGECWRGAAVPILVHMLPNGNPIPCGEHRNRMDLLTWVLHEFGHTLGFHYKSAQPVPPGFQPYIAEVADGDVDVTDFAVLSLPVGAGNDNARSHFDPNAVVRGIPLSHLLMCPATPLSFRTYISPYDVAAVAKVLAVPNPSLYTLNPQEPLSLFSDDFEGYNAPAALSGQVPLFGHGAYHVPAATPNDALVETFAGNALGIPAFPNVAGAPTTASGNHKFAVGERNAAGTAGAQHLACFGPGNDHFRISFDVCPKFNGNLPAANDIGGLSLQPESNARHFTALARWTNPNTADSWDANLVYFNAAGQTITGPVPDVGFQQLPAGQWYRFEVEWDFVTNKITKIRLLRWASLTQRIYTPTNWYLAGGANPANRAIPSELRLYAGGNLPGNVIAFDNIQGQPIPAPFHMSLNTGGGLGPNLTVGLTGVPLGTDQGYCVYSTLATEALGGGPVFGLYPDFLTIGSLSQPAVTGSPLHWTWPVTSPLFPASNFFVPLVPFGTGQPLDGVGVALTAAYSITGITPVVRVVF